MKFLIVLALLIVLQCLSGCTTTLTHGTQSRALDPWRPQANLNFNGSVSTGPVTSTVDAGAGLYDDLRSEEGMINEDDAREYLDAVISWVLFRPSFGPEFIARLGLPVPGKLWEGWDLGVRYNGSVIKGDLKLQFFESWDGFMQAALHLGYGHHLGLVGSAVEWATLTEFSRKDFDVGVSWGFQRGDWFKFYALPRLVASRISTDSKIPGFIQDRLPEQVENYNPNQFFPSEWMLYFAGTTGMMVGYKYAYLNLELTVARLRFRPEVLGQERNLSGWVISPMAGIVATF